MMKTNGLPKIWLRYFALLAAALPPLLLHSAKPESFHFAILGDRTGETVAGVYGQVLREAAAENPAFALSVGDSIQGLNDATAEEEWREFEKLRAPYRKISLYLTPGNHDIWGPPSEALFRKYSGRATHYGFDYGQAHFTILDNSRTEQFSPEELNFLEADLQAHDSQPLKFIVSHRPSWILETLVGNPDFRLHALAKKHRVQYVLSGHIHQMWHADLEGVTYLSLPSSGGHLRASQKYEDGWFFAHALVAVASAEADFQIREAGPPAGAGRVTGLGVWGKAGLLKP